jgi:hypothetical protein
MKSSFLRRGMAAASIAVSAGAIVMAAGLPASAAAAQPAAQARLATAARPAVSPAWAFVLVTGCTHHGVIMPSSYVLACGDGNDYLTGLHWVSWHSVAYGWGWEKINSCTPNCARGHFRSYPVLVNLWRARVRGHLRQFKYTRLTVVYTRKRPLRFTSHGKRHHPPTYTWHV